MTSDRDSKRQYVETSFGQAAPVYASSPYFAAPGRRLVELAQIGTGDRVLDIATGRGAVLIPACERVGPSGHVLGIDLAEPMVRATAADVARLGIKQAEVRKMNAEHLDLPDASFDAVLCGFALWFIPDLDSALSEIRRVLKPGGAFAASTWGETSALNRAYSQLLRSHGAGPDNLASHSLNTPEALARALSNAGFAEVEAHTEPVPSSFADAESWWSQTGSRPQATHMLSAEQLEAVKQAGMALAETFKSDGPIVETRTAVIATARNP